ncbi:MAG: uroporphyrinogen-III C-methyltransferase, partial [Candidatus Dormibacteria bacterium]
MGQPLVAAGRVYLVGAGPGDPGLVTLRAAAVLAAADIVYHDQLVSPEVLSLARDGCELVDIGHRAGRQPRDIPDMVKQMATAAQRGLVVVRLKGGDPFLFGRGGEEVEALLEEGAAFEVVPGVSSALAGPAAAGIPVTHRGLAASVAIVTGHGRSGEAGIDWKCLRADTVVVLMGNSRLSQLSQDMVAAGWQPSTPAAVVMAATTARQRQVVAPLSDIAAAA